MVYDKEATPTVIIIIIIIIINYYHVHLTGQDVQVYDLSTKTVKTKTWSHLPACTSALRWLEHYYCFHGNNFTRFNPISGEVNGTYPKDARNYFMRCSDFGELTLVTLVSSGRTE